MTAINQFQKSRLRLPMVLPANLNIVFEFILFVFEIFQTFLGPSLYHFVKLKEIAELA